MADLRPERDRSSNMVRPGIDVLCGTGRYDGLLRGRRLGLIVTASSVSGRLESTVDALHRRYGLTALFGPEHGVRGDVEAGSPVETYRDEATGLPVYSLYRKDSKRLTEEMLRDIDVMIYDIQDVGSRYYTYLYTMLYCMEDCARAGIPFVVLDRPDPLGGETVEGNILEEEYRSFVGDYPLCMRYGLTPGELAAMFHDSLDKKASLTVVPCEGWNRKMLWPHTGLPWAAPSPALTGFEGALLYSGTCLFEGTNLSEGRGTAAPFRWIGAPYLTRPERLARRLNEGGMEGILARPVYFTPQSGKHRDKLCGGVELHVTDAGNARPVATALALLYAVREEYPEDFAWCTPLPPATRPHIELLSGSGRLTGGTPLKELLEVYRRDEAVFREIKAEYHIYG